MVTKKYFRSGNHFVTKIKGMYQIGEAAPTIKCKCPSHQTGSTYPDSFDGIEEAIKACICMASRSLEAKSGVQIVKD